MQDLPFLDREDAARALAGALAGYAGTAPVVLGVPRGGMPMARIVADALDGELDMVLVRKLGAPGNPEVAIGAVDERGAILLNIDPVAAGIDPAWIEREARAQLSLIRERRARHGGVGAPALAGRTVIVIDDGLATGATMAAALRAVRAQHPKRLVCAVPVAAPDSLAAVKRIADEVVCLATPWPFRAVSLYYRHFGEVTDSDVARVLQRTGPASTAPPEPPARAVRIPAGNVVLEGGLAIPDDPIGLVVFAHGSGSSRHSPRNRFVAGVLQRRHVATLLFDLLTPGEDAERANRFDIARLAERLEAAVDWALAEPRLRGLPLGVFGSSTGAAAALAVAVNRAHAIATVVSRGGRPDLAGPRVLERIHVPVLLIVGAADQDVLALNRAAQSAIGAWAEVSVVPGAGHLFEEPGTLERAASLAADWFERVLRDAAPRVPTPGGDRSRAGGPPGCGTR
jgi:predicted phosphoribosyltransferase/dienelactone hydrolase